MPGLRDIKRRVDSIQSTRQITRTMEMVATAKVRHATERIQAATPYSEAMVKTLGSLSARDANIKHPLLEEHEEKKNAIAIAVVSDRGLAGGFNSNILRMVDTYRTENEAAGIKTGIIVCGKKGAGYFMYRNVEPLMVFRDMSADPTIMEAREISSYVRSRFLDNTADEVKIFYNHARNAADQDLREEIILPVQGEALQGTAPADGEEEGKTAAQPMSWGFEPSSDVVLDHLLPSYVETVIFHALLDSAAAEQGARRKAMKSATDNANEMIETLNRLYNRARQGAITTEITEIVGGAAALEE